MRQQRRNRVFELFGTGIADDRAVEMSQAAPVDRAARLAVHVVAVHERERIAAARIGDGDAGVDRARHRRRHARHDFKPDALLVQEQRFRRAAVEHERVAPFQPRHGFALTRFLDKQKRDGVLFRRLRRCAADVDLFRAGAGMRQ